ncbi:MAG: hypothetical protein Q8Q01_03745 [archaeon]|nr:hypothetical protein [archaeon]
MSNHKAKYYARSNKGTIFDLDRILLTSTGCDTKPNKNWIGRVRDYEANLSIEVESIEYSCPYTIPKDFKIGEELVPIENKIYLFINDILSDINDNLEKKKIENEVKSLEAAILEIPHDHLDDSLQWEMYEDKYVERLILSIKNVTGITSLSKKRFQEYRSLLSGQVKISQKDNKNEFDNTDITSQERLYNVVGFINTMPTDTEGSLSNKVRQYLANEPITEQDLDIIINQFVPSLLKINKNYSKLRRKETIPTDISDHAFNSFLEGGLTGWITMSIFGESVINGILSTDIHIPGWYIGAGIYFALPYVRTLFTKKKAEDYYNSENDRLINLYEDQIFKSEEEKSTITRLRDTKLIKPRVSGSLTEIK